MKSFIYFVLTAAVLVLSVSLAESSTWVQLNCDPVCFEGKNNKPGIFNSRHSGFAAAVKLVHKSGHIRCGSSYSKHDSNFGCHDWPGIQKHSLNVVVTNADNQVKFPVNEFNKFKSNNGYWYGLDGVNSVSKEIVLQKDFAHPYFLNQDHVLKVWYGEDLFDYTESDNHGRVCVDVFGYFV